MNIYYYGPSGSGKSTIGQLLAERLDWRFIDLDAEIESRSGRVIADIFTNEGETYFRSLEKACLKDFSQTDFSVIALGGGALVNLDNQVLLRPGDPVIFLEAEIDTILERLNQDRNQRPLLSGSARTQLENLLESRREHYASYKLRIATDKISPLDVVWESQLKTGVYRISGMGKDYSVQVWPNGLMDVASQLEEMNINGPFVVASDTSVGPIYGTVLVQHLRDAGYQASLVTIPEGEDEKSIATVGKLWQAFLTAGLDRKSTVLALGGGVVGDLVGFASATYLRGVAWINLPTSILAMVDASLGGKTGANLPKGKNLIGAFHAPSYVMTDTTTISTLPERHRRNGLSEVIKHGVIDDPVLFSMCDEGWENVNDNWDAIIKRAIGVKAKVIQEDPFELGLRQSLNLGHTVGHGVEKASNFQLLHGEAVSIGMVIEAKMAEGLGLAEEGLAAEISRVLKGVGLPVEIPPGIDRQQVVNYMKYDKKKTKGKVKFALPTAIGDTKVGVEVDDYERYLV